MSNMLADRDRSLQLQYRLSIFHAKYQATFSIRATLCCCKAAPCPPACTEKVPQRGRLFLQAAHYGSEPLRSSNLRTYSAPFYSLVETLRSYCCFCEWDKWDINHPPRSLSHLRFYNHFFFTLLECHYHKHHGTTETHRHNLTEWKICILPER